MTDLFEENGVYKEPTLEQRDRMFRNNLWKLMGKTFAVFPKWLVEEFCDHWTEVGPNDRLMPWEKEKKKKSFDPMRRLKRFKRNSQEWHPNKWPKEELQFKDFFSRAFMRGLTGGQQLLYMKHLETKGYKYVRSKHGGQSHVVCPNGKREWL